MDERKNEVKPIQNANDARELAIKFQLTIEQVLCNVESTARQRQYNHWGYMPDEVLNELVNRGFKVSKVKTPIHESITIIEW